ncbi:SgcJ/EcaC family oxidoreductase [Ekhidna sp.]
MKIISIITILLSCISSYGQNKQDEKAILQVIENQNRGWATKDLELSLQDVDDNIDWTNAFGDRMESKKQLETLLKRIYSFDFVMKGKSKNQYNDINFLSPEIAIVRSKTVVKGQEWGDGTAMKDRHNHHLRVFHKKDDSWKVVSHLISQAWEKK